MDERAMQIARTLNHLGALGLLAELSIKLRPSQAYECRQSIEACLAEAEKLGLIRYQRILSRFVVEPAASAVLSRARSPSR